MTKEYDSYGRQKLGTDYAAITGFPPYLTAIGALAAPGSGDWLIKYDGDTDSWSFTTFTGFTIDATDVTYTSTGSQWTAVDVAVALHDLEAAVDVLQDTVGGVVTETSGNQASFTLTGFTVNPSGTIYWVKTGNKVFVYVRADITGTSNSAVFASSSTLPASIRPAHQKVVAMGQMGDSGGLVPASVEVHTDGSLVFLRHYYNGSATVCDPVWSTSGTKAWIAGCGFSYDLD